MNYENSYTKLYFYELNTIEYTVVLPACLNYLT